MGALDELISICEGERGEVSLLHMSVNSVYVPTVLRCFSSWQLTPCCWRVLHFFPPFDSPPPSTLTAPSPSLVTSTSDNCVDPTPGLISKTSADRVHVQLNVVNGAKSIVFVSWLDERAGGAEKRFAELKEGERYEANSFKGHAWRVRGKEGVLIAEYVVGSPHSDVVISKDTVTSGGLKGAADRSDGGFTATLTVTGKCFGEEAAEGVNKNGQSKIHIVLEDDLVLKPLFKETVVDTINRLPDDWDMYLINW